MYYQIIGLFLLLFHTIVYSVIGNPGIRIDESFRNIELKEALTILSEKYELKIAYSDQAVADIIINKDIQNQSVSNAFRKILTSTTLTFELLEDDVIIVKKKNRGADPRIYSLTGVVQDAVSGERLPYAYVWLESESRNLLTNVDGYFSISATELPIALKISYLGYRDTTIHVTDQSLNKRLYVNLESAPYELKEVIISEQTTDNFEINERSGRIDVNPRLSYSMPSAGEVDLMRTIQLLPGINATNESSSGLSIQGGNTNQNLFLFDGFTVYHTDHFFGYFSAFNPSAVKSIQLYKGGYDARYGGRVSGVIDISGKEGNLRKTSGSVGINLLSINTSLEVPLKENKTSLFFSGRRSYTDIISTSLFEKIFENYAPGLSNEPTPAPPTGGNQMGQGHHGNTSNTPRVSTLESSLNPEFYYTDLNLKLSTKIGLKDHISFSFYDSNDILNYKERRKSNIDDTLTISENSLGLVNWGNIGTSFKWSRLWNQTHYSNALISFSRYGSEYNETSTSTITNLQGESATVSTTVEQQNSIRDITLKMDHEWAMRGDQLIRIGFQASVLGTNYRSIADDTTFVERIELNKGLFTMYGLSILQIMNGLTLNIGLRGNYYTNTQGWYPEPRLSLTYQISPKLRLKGAYGIYHQFINQSNTKNALQGSRDFWLLADDATIPIQRADHLSAGFDYQAGSFIFNAEYFHRQFDGLLEYSFSNGGLVTEFDNYEDMFFEGSGKSEGFELLLKRNSKKVNAWIGYTYSTVKEQFDDLNKGENYYADYDQRHEINTYGSYKLGKFELFGTWIYGTGKPYSLTIGSLPNSQTMGNFNEHVTIVDVEEKNGLRLPEYHRLDIGGKYTFLFDNFNMVMALSVFNVYNRQNILDYRFRTLLQGHAMGHGITDPVIESVAVTSLGITPNISLTVNF